MREETSKQTFDHTPVLLNLNLPSSLKRFYVYLVFVKGVRTGNDAN